MCDSYELLANAIVLLAVNDYRRALRKLQSNPKYEPAKKTKQDVERFFRSSWYAELTSVNPETLICKLIEEGAQ